jgi:LAGLIDADG DNA endonuclease family
LLLLNPLESFNSKVTIALFYITALFSDVVYIHSIDLDIGIISGLLLSLMPPVTPAEDMPSRKLTKEEKASLSLSERLKQILVGLLLGDLYAQKQNVNTRLQFKQGVIHKDYLMHLYELFSNYCFNAPKIFDLNPHKLTAKVYSSMRFTTYTLSCFNELHDLFYVDGKKVIPLNIGELLTPLGLCY